MEKQVLEQIARIQQLRDEACDADSYADRQCIRKEIRKEEDYLNHLLGGYKDSAGNWWF